MAYRPHRSARQWQQLVDRQARSSKSAREFCADQDIGYASFIQWRSRLTDSESSTRLAAESTPQFIELTSGMDEHRQHELEQVSHTTPIRVLTANLREYGVTVHD